MTEEHQARFTLVDARGYQRVGYPGFAATPEGLAHDLRILEDEAAELALARRPRILPPR